ncbi:MAG: hypothetical protein WCS37_10335 [Chloroflexota bacterium]|nr:response regulator transcription factor [Chloroflexota bacterium]
MVKESDEDWTFKSVVVFRGIDWPERYIEELFQQFNLQITEVVSGREGLHNFSFTCVAPDLILVSQRLPDMCWQDLLTHLRRFPHIRQTTVIICAEEHWPSARADLLHLRCLPVEVAPNAYLLCFLSLKLLEAFFLKGQANMDNSTCPTIIGVGKFQYDRVKQRAMIEGQYEPRITLTLFKLYCILVDHKGHWLSKDELGHLIFDEANYAHQPGDQRLEKQIKRLRQIIEPQGQPWHYLLTENGGFILEEPDLPSHNRH